MIDEECVSWNAQRRWVYNYKWVIEHCGPNKSKQNSPTPSIHPPGQSAFTRIGYHYWNPRMSMISTGEEGAYKLTTVYK